MLFCLSGRCATFRATPKAQRHAWMPRAGYMGSAGSGAFGAVVEGKVFGAFHLEIVMHITKNRISYKFRLCLNLR